jgi:tetratricopeptide (TPR) repeat protein
VRGQVDEDVGRHDLAAEWYRKSLAEHPTAAAALRLARVCYLLGRWEEVAAAGEQARELADAPQPLDAGEVDADVVAPMVAAALCRLGRHEEASELCPRPRRS